MDTGRTAQLGVTAGFAIDEFLDHQSKTEEFGNTFKLTASSVGRSEVFKARVRRLSLWKTAEAKKLPQHVREMVFRALKEVEAEQKRARDEGRSPDSLEDILKDNDQVLRAADALCVAAFMDPPLVLKESEQRPGAMWVGKIEAEDRVAFFMACSDAESGSAKRLELFRPRPSVDVPHREVESVAPAPVEHSGPLAGGVQRGDVS